MFSSLLEFTATILGAAVVAVLLLLLALAGVVYWFYRKAMKGWQPEAYASQLSWLPPRIHLLPDKGTKEDKADRTEKRVEALLALGFQSIGKYIVGNYEGLKLRALINSHHACGAMVYHLVGTGTWTEIFQVNSNGDWISASNVKKRQHFQHLPGERKFHEAQMSERELVELVLASREAGAVLPSDPEVFGQMYEEAFGRRADSRLLEPLEDYEIRQLLRESNLSTCSEEPAEISESDMRGIREHYAVQVNRQLASACTLDLARSGAVAASEWQRSKHRLLVIHDRTKFPELVRKRSCEGFVSEQLKKLLKKQRDNSNPREMFARINAKLKAGDRYHKLASVQKPLAADIYRGPLESFLSDS